MGRYIDWADVVQRYPRVGDVGGSTEVGSSYLGYAETQIDGMLASHFTTPFSSNNNTVKDLCIELVYANAGNLTVKESDSKRRMIKERIENLKSGAEIMILEDGTQLLATGEVIYSNTMGYTPVFGMSPIEYSEVDSSQVYDEEEDRGNL